MKIFYEIQPHLIRQSAVALGFFDGVHLGHQAVIKIAVEQARSRGIVPAVVTFKDHPRALTRGNSPLLLTLIEQRLAIFESLGIEAALVLTFTEELCRLSPEQYVETVLMQSMGAELIAVGYNHHFGREREGNPQLLSQFGKNMHFVVEVANPVYLDSKEVSSSVIRGYIEKADLGLANQMLGRPYSLMGKVIEGDKRGRELGFPTANMDVSPFQIIPANGVYAAQVKLSDQSLHQAVVNIGCRPTFADRSGTARVTEVHILNFKGDLYGSNLTVFFQKYLRPEMKFSGIGPLQAQIKDDCQAATDLLSSLSLFAGQ